MLDRNINQPEPMGLPLPYFTLHENFKSLSKNNFYSNIMLFIIIIFLLFFITRKN